MENNNNSVIKVDIVSGARVVDELMTELTMDE